MDIVEKNKIEENFDDELYLFSYAVDIAVSSGMASASGLARRLRVDFTKACKIVDMMEAAGIIGPADGARPREILVDKDGANNILANVTVSLLKQIKSNTK
ncbi:MAG: hypothetical protein LBS36_04280 [Oscillospiraceae bacterium]|nr:hypothetical protein [Oscillospiraceae bacterium]